MLHPYFGYVVDPRAPGINPYGFFRRAPLTTRSPDSCSSSPSSAARSPTRSFTLGQNALIAALRRDAPHFADRQIECSAPRSAATSSRSSCWCSPTCWPWARSSMWSSTSTASTRSMAPPTTSRTASTRTIPTLARAARARRSTRRHGAHGRGAHRSARSATRCASVRALAGGAAQRLPAGPVGLRSTGASWRRCAARRRRSTALRSQEKPPQVTGPPFAFDDADAMFADFVEVWARASLEMENLCRGQGIEYLHFLQPNQYFEGSKVLNETSGGRLGCRRRRRRAGRDRLSAAGRARPRAGEAGRRLPRPDDALPATSRAASTRHLLPLQPARRRRVAEAIAAAIIARNQRSRTKPRRLHTEERRHGECRVEPGFLRCSATPCESSSSLR